MTLRGVHLTLTGAAQVSLGLETAAGDPVPVKKEFPVSKFGWSPITLKLLPGVPVLMKIKLVPSGAFLASPARREPHYLP